MELNPEAPAVDVFARGSLFAHCGVVDYASQADYRVAPWNTQRQFASTVYTVTSVTLTKFRQRAGDGLASLSKEERREYGRAVSEAVKAKQRSELFAGLEPVTPKPRCASRTWHTTGVAIHEAIKQQQLTALLAYPAKVRKQRTDVEWRQMYAEAMKAKRAAQAAVTDLAA